MITERGTIVVRTPVTVQVQGELNKGTKVIGILSTVLGGIFAFIFLIVLIAARFSFPLFMLGAVLLACGIVILVHTSNLNKAMAARSVVDEVEFFRDYCILREFTNGEHTATNKIYYSRVAKKRETANYIFIYNTAVTAVAVGKRDVNPNELNAIRKLIGMAVIGATYSVPPTYGNFTANGNNGGFNGASGGNFGAGAGNARGANPPADPFEDFSPDNGKELR